MPNKTSKRCSYTTLILTNISIVMVPNNSIKTFRFKIGMNNYSLNSNLPIVHIYK